MNRAERERQGRRGEALAALFLQIKGWRILARRVKTARGEIDLIARRAGTLAFIEVKWRKTSAARDISVDEYRLRRVAAAAVAVAHHYMRPGDMLRIDALLLAPGRFPRHIANVWQP